MYDKNFNNSKYKFISTDYLNKSLWKTLKYRNGSLVKYYEKGKNKRGKYYAEFKNNKLHGTYQELTSKFENYKCVFNEGMLDGHYEKNKPSGNFAKLRFSNGYFDGKCALSLKNYRKSGHHYHYIVNFELGYIININIYDRHQYEDDLGPRQCELKIDNGKCIINRFKNTYFIHRVTLFMDIFQHFGIKLSNYKIVSFCNGKPDNPH